MGNKELSGQILSMTKTPFFLECRDMLNKPIFKSLRINIPVYCVYNIFYTIQNLK